MKKNYGFIAPEITDDNYVLGSSPLGQVVLELDRNWLPFVPEFEPQQKKFETYNCTGFNTLNAIETLMGRLGVVENYSDRWLGIIAGTKAPGNDPHVVAEAIRKNGLIPESMLPYSDDLKNVDEYYSFKGADEAKCRAEGKKWLERYDFGHEWVFKGGSNKPEKILEALQFSPVGVSVQAWKKEGALFTKPKGGQDNHWTCNVVGMKEKQYWIIDDSYLDDSQPLKYLKWDYDFGFAKRYSITIKNKQEQVSIIQKLLTLLTPFLSFIKTHPEAKLTDEVPGTPPSSVETPKATMRELIHKEARRWLGKDASPSNQAPNEVACAESVCHILRQIGLEVPALVSTIKFNSWLKTNPLFTLTTESKPGNIILSVTGTGNGSIGGHTGIFGEGGRIMSNDSLVGLWLENYTIDGWIKRWRDKGGMKIYYFEIKN